jgi:hypothetical protein
LNLLPDYNLKTPDGRYYYPQLYKKLVGDCYIISKVLHIPYSDVLDMSIIEKEYILEYIKQDNDMQNKRIQESIQNMRNNQNK